MVKPVFTEHSHHSAVLHFAVFDNQVKKKLPHQRSLLLVSEPMVFYNLRYREQCPRVKPARYVVVRRMIKKRLCRYVEYMPLQVLKVVNCKQFVTSLRVTYNKIAKAEIALDGVSKVYREFLRVLIKKLPA